MEPYEGSRNQLDDEGVVHLIKQILLTEDVSFFAKFGDLVSIHRLDSNGVSGSFDLSQAHLAIGALTNHLAELEVVDGVLGFGVLAFRLFLRALHYFIITNFF